jgi:flagellar assembly protein FliH
MGLELEVFETHESAKHTPMVMLQTIAFEEAKLSSYETGYKAGWDDAAQAQADDQRRVNTELARNIQSMGFTFEQARAHVLQATAPLLQKIVEHLLPALARETLGPIILQTLLPMADAAGGAPIQLVIHPAARAGVEPLLLQTGGLPITIIDEQTLGEAQAFLRFDTAETQIDLDHAIAEISIAVRNFYELPERNPNHG